jgi:hypothetical protein
VHGHAETGFEELKIGDRIRDLRNESLVEADLLQPSVAPERYAAIVVADSEDNRASAGTIKRETGFLCVEMRMVPTHLKPRWRVYLSGSVGGEA